MKTKIPSALVTAALPASCLLPGNAEAGIIVNIEEQGSDVVVSYSGSIDLTGANFYTTGGASSNTVNAGTGQGLFQNGAATRFSFVGRGGNPWSVAPSSFGTGGHFNADSVSIAAGNAWGFRPEGFHVEPTYVSGDPISGSITFENQTLASMGINEGTGIMNATFSSGDTLTVNAISAVSTSAIPEPSGVLGLAGLILGSGFLRRRKLA